MSTSDERSVLLLNIINSSLVFEYGVSKTLIQLFSINNPEKTKNFNPKGGLSIKNKIDFFYDFDLINKEEYMSLILQIEIRNKFVHNIEIQTLENCIDNLGDNATKNRFKNLNGDTFSEKYESLFNANQEIIKKIISDHSALIVKRADYIFKFRNNLYFALEESSKLISTLYEDLVSKGVDDNICNEFISDADAKIKLLQEKILSDNMMTENQFMQLITGTKKEV